MKTGRRNNLGISLVELLVVISILSVLSAGLMTGISMLSGKKAQECVSKINAAIGKTRLETLSKSVGAETLDELDTYLRVYRADDNTVHATICVKGAEEDTKVGDAAVVVQYLNHGDGIVYELTNPQDSFRLGFDRSTGAFMTNGNNYVERIMVTQGLKTYQIDITQETGKYKAYK